MNAPKHLAIITGCSRGLGASCCVEFLGQGCKVFGLARTSPPERVASHGQFQFVETDLAQAPCTDKIERALTEQAEIFERTTLVLNASSVEPVGPFASLDVGEIQRALHIHISSTIELVHWMLKRPRHGLVHIVFVSSGVAQSPVPTLAVYSLGKAAIEALFASLQQEYHDKEDVQFHVFNPGVMDTEMQTDLRNHQAYTKRELHQGWFEAGRLSSSDLVAKNLVKELFPA